MDKKKGYVRKLNKNDFEGFKKVLLVFREAPWYENLTDQDVIDEWNLYVKSDIEKDLESKVGIKPNDDYSVFGYFNEDDELVSMITYTMSYGNHEDHKEHGVEFNDEDIVGYIYGMATSLEHRGKGYNTKILSELVKYFKEINIDKSYARYAVSRFDIALSNASCAFHNQEIETSVYWLKKALANQLFTNLHKLESHQTYGKAFATIQEMYSYFDHIFDDIKLMLKDGNYKQAETIVKSNIVSLNNLIEEQISGKTGNVKYMDKSQSIAILENGGYHKYCKDGTLHVQNLTDAGYKFNHTEEDLRAYAIQDIKLSKKLDEQEEYIEFLVDYQDEIQEEQSTLQTKMSKDYTKTLSLNY